MTYNLDNPIEPMNEISLIKQTYQAPQLIPLSSFDIGNNEGFGTDAGLDVGAS